MKQSHIYSKYSCDDKLNIYSNPPMNYSAYKKRLLNTKSRYMDDYKNSTARISKYNEEKNFNNLLTNYYEDYNKIKNKYNLTEEEDTKNYEISDEEFMIKKQNLKKLFNTDVLDIQDFNFDLTDNLINELPKENNYSLLKNTQIKEDYEFRLQNSNKNDKFSIPNEEKIEDEENENEDNLNNNDINNINNEIEDNVNIKRESNNDIILESANKEKENNNNNISENDNKDNINEEENKSIEYLENPEQFNLENNENYLILNQQNLDDDLPLFNDIISYNYNKNYRVPFYEFPETHLIEGEKIKKKEGEEEGGYSDFEKNGDNNNKQEGYSDFEKKEKKENVDINNEGGDKLILENNNNNENIKLEDVIKSDFNGDYKIPEYKIPDNLKKEIEKQKTEEENDNNKFIIEENKKSNILANSNNDNLKIMDDIIKKEDNEGEFVEVTDIKKKEEEKVEETKVIKNKESIEAEMNKNEEEPKNENVNKNQENKIDDKNEDEEDQFEKIDVDGLDDDEDDKKYNDFDG